MTTDFGGPGFFPLPEPLIEGPAPRVMSLRDGTAKMSKSDPSDQSRINLLDDADAISKKFKRAKSDADLLPETWAELAGRPEAANLVSIYAALAGVPRPDALARFAGKGFGALKPELADLAVESLAPVTVAATRRDGAARARAAADPVIAEAKAVVGFWR